MIMVKIFLCKIFGIFIILLVDCAKSDDALNACDKRPLGNTAKPLRPDNKFILEVDNIKNEQYIPKNTYTVTLRSKDESTKFIAFTISLKESSLPNKYNPRRPIPLYAGELEPFPDSVSAIPSPNCANTIIQSNVVPKTKVQVNWHAPGKDNKCVTIYAMVAVSKSVWYSYEPPLSLKVCEDPRKSEDKPPDEVDGDCQTCEDARYQLMFEGIWTYNTHHGMFPRTIELARFSDLVGASHSPDTWLFQYGSEASIGIKMLAEQGNTTQFEIETQKKLPTTVRTVIKATKPQNTSMSTVSSFRATPHHHRLSMAVGILPSPDWFLGVSQLELCDATTLSWNQNITLNLYPIDAGTDKGLDFESSNEEQSPQQSINRLEKIGKEQINPNKPFAKIHLTLVRTYTTPKCSPEETVTETEGENGNENVDTSGDNEEGNEDREGRPPYDSERTTTTSEDPETDVDQDASDLCPMTDWDEWSPCEGLCENGILSGAQTRLRYHIVNGVVIKNMERGPRLPQYCIDHPPQDIEFQPCTDSCVVNREEGGEEGETQAEAF